jgi:hypothetical protein
MFFKKKIKTKHAVMHISLNRDAAEFWIANRKDIGIEHDWDKDEVGKSHISIDFLIQHGLCFHRNANQFSTSFEGHQLHGGKLFQWKEFDSELVFYFNFEVIAVFPKAIIIALIKTGNNGMGVSFRHPEEKILYPEPPTENCFQMMRQFWSSYGVIYWNDLVRIDFTVDAPASEVEYPVVR